MRRRTVPAGPTKRAGPARRRGWRSTAASARRPPARPACGPASRRRKRGLGTWSQSSTSHELAGGLGQRGVDVAGLRPLAALTAVVFGAHPLGECLHRVVAAVVEQVHPHARVAHRLREHQRGLHDFHRLAVDRHQHVHLGRSAQGSDWAGRPVAGRRPPEAQRLRQVEHLGGHQQREQHGVTHPLGLQQPAEVPGGEGQAEKQQGAHGKAPGARRRTGVPGGLQQAEIGALGAHRPNSHTRTWDFSKRSVSSARRFRRLAAFFAESSCWGLSRKLPSTYTCWP